MRNKIMLISVLVGMSSGLVGCQGDERIGEVSAVEKQAQIKVENELALKMEEDLQTRLKFYQGVSGTFVGATTNGAGQTFKITIRLSHTPIFIPEDRIRMREEITPDLLTLSFNTAQVRMFSVDGKPFVGECTGSQIKAELNAGVIPIPPSSECPNGYTIQIHNQGLINGRVEGASFENSEAVARSLMKGKEGPIQALYGTTTLNTGEILKFSAERVIEKN